MKELINIWGKRGCELPGGGLCTACCVLPEIELEGVYVSVGKPANTPCPNIEDGCRLHEAGTKPDACKVWHCSMADKKGKFELVAQGLSLGQVTEAEAVSVGGEEVLEKAANLSIITHRRDFVTRDLVEP